MASGRLALKEQSTLERQWAFIRILGSSPKGVTVQELAMGANVSERTVKRDLSLLKRAGFPFEETAGEHNLKYWRVDADRALPAALRWDEAAALFVARQLMRSLDGTCVAESFESIATKVELALSADARKLLERMAATVLFKPGPRADYRFKREHLEALQVAVDERRLTWITYHSQSATEPVTYEVHPYGLVFAKNTVYLVAYSTRHSEVRHFKIDRMSDVDAQQLKFPKPADFNIEEHLAGSWGIYRGKTQNSLTIRVRFCREVARYVQEKSWHHSQLLEPQTDGSLDAEFQLTALEEIQGWLLSFGSKVKVLSPPELVDRLREESARLFELYQLTSPSPGEPTKPLRRKPQRTD